MFGPTAQLLENAAVSRETGAATHRYVAQAACRYPPSLEPRPGSHPRGACWHLPVLRPRTGHRDGLKLVRWPLLLAILLAVIAALYRYGPNVRQTWRQCLPGAALAVLLWVGGRAVPRHPGIRRSRRGGV